MPHPRRSCTHWPIAIRLVVMAMAGALCMVLVAVTALPIARRDC